MLKATGASKGSLYHHFANKRQLYEAVLERVEERLAQATVDAASGIRDPLEALRAGCRTFLRPAREPEIRQIVLRDAPTVIGWEQWRALDKRYAFGLLKHSVMAIGPKGSLDPDALAHLLLAALAMLQAHPDATSLDAQAALDAVLDRLLG